MSLAPTFEDYLGVGLAAAQAARNELLLDEGDISHQMMAAAAAMADANTEYASRLYRQTFLEGNVGASLVERVTDRFKELTPKTENAASASLSFSRPTAAAGAGFLPAGFVVATGISSEGKRSEFATLADVFFGASDLGPVTVLATARAAGSDGNVDAGKITQLVSGAFDTSITVTNPARAGGGADAETDDEYRARARAYPRTLQRGTKAAVELGARGVPGVRNVSVTVDEIGIMTVYVADASGGSTQTLIDAVREELDLWVAAGAVYSVVGGEVLQQNVTVRLTMARGRAADVEGIVQDTVTDELAKLQAGDVLYRLDIATSIKNLDRAKYKNVIVDLPADDVTPLPHQIIRAGTIVVVDA